MKVLVCGSRHFNDTDRINRELKAIGNISEIIHGGAPGADTCAGTFARDNSIPVKRYPALWDIHGKSAGPIRNRQMLTEGKPDLVIAFLGEVAQQEIFYGLSDSQHSRGTKNMIQLATKAGIPVKVIEI